MKKLVPSCLVFAALFCMAASQAQAAIGTIWGNNASFGPDIVNNIDLSTGADLKTFTVSNGNGRGVVTVGNILYTTQVGDSKIYKTDAATGVGLGFIQTAQASMATIAFDGTNFWTSDYSGTNRAFEIAPDGTTIKTITLGNAGSNMDGMEWFNGKLIANRGDAVGNYDIYDLDGNLLQADFITPPGNATGIAYDGTNFWISNIFANSLGQYDGVTGQLISTLSLQGSHLIEDLSFDYAQRTDTGGNNVIPEPSTLVLLASSCLAGLRFIRRKPNI